MPAGTLQTYSANFHNNATAATFRAWAQAISTNLQAAGLVKTADTGQIDLTTAALPAANTAGGYEIYRFDDTLQATAPIFIKIEYGSGTTTTQGQVWITVGSGTNGSGTLTDPLNKNTVSTRRQLTATSASSQQTNTVSSYAFVLTDKSACWLMHTPSQATDFSGFFFFVERSRNFDGTPTGDGYVFGHTSLTSTTSTVSCEQRNYVVSSGIQPNGNSITAWPSGANTLASTYQTYVVGSIWYPSPVFTGAVPRLYGPSQIVLVGGRSDFPNLQTFTMDHYGASRDWIFAGLGATNQALGWGALGGAASSFCARTSG